MKRVAISISLAAALVACTSAPNDPEITGLFSYMADSASFVDCRSGKRYPVAMEDGYLELERAYSATPGEPNKSVFVRVRGRIEPRPPMEGTELKAHLVVERHVALEPGRQCPPQATPP